MSQENDNNDNKTLSPPPSPTIPGTPVPSNVSTGNQTETAEEIAKRYESILKSNAEFFNFRIRELESQIAEQRANSISDQLWIWIKDCKQKRNAYWKLYYSYQKWNNTMSVPLLLISSATGISSVVQLGENMPEVKWLVAILGVGSTALAAFQRYFRYGEKSEQCKAIAKRYALLARKGELQANLFENKTINLQELVVFMEDFRKDLDAIQQETDDMPKEILERKQVVDPNATTEEIRQDAMNEDGDKAERRHVMVQMVPSDVRRAVMVSKSVN